MKKSTLVNCQLFWMRVQKGLGFQKVDFGHPKAMLAKLMLQIYNKDVLSHIGCASANLYIDQLSEVVLTSITSFYLLENMFETSCNYFFIRYNMHEGFRFLHGSLF